MPEIKNTFLQSKMNKDLDARLVPNGQYRDAQNININKSEGPDAGARKTKPSYLKRSFRGYSYADHQSLFARNIKSF